MNMGPLFRFVRRSYCRACICAGPSLLLIALGIAICTGWFLHRSIAADGAVVSLRQMLDSDEDSIGYAPVFTFTAGDGHIYTISSNTSSSPPAFSPGQHVKVLYRADDPTGARIASFGQLWLFPFVFAIVGTAACGSGYVLFRYERHRDPEFTFWPSWSSTPKAPHAG